MAATGCADAAPLDGASEDQEVMELVPARVDGVRSPLFVFSNEVLTLDLWGLHPDPCTRFDRFVTAPFDDGKTLRVDAWAARPVGSCPGDALPWEASLTVAGLPVGPRTVLFEGAGLADVVVLSADRETCGESEPIEVHRAELPAATHIGGSATLEVEVVHPSPCHGEPRIEHEVVDGVLLLQASAALCGPVDDPEACPPWSMPLVLEHEVGPLEEEVATLSFGTGNAVFEVVEPSDCRIERMRVGSAHGPRLVSSEDALELAVTGWLPVCGALDSVSWRIDGDRLLVELLTRECGDGCGEDAPSIESEMDVSLEGVPPGRWEVIVEGAAVPADVIVAPAEACTEKTVPEDAVAAVLATSGLYDDLDSEAVSQDSPIDVHVVGERPDGCWGQPRLELTSGEGDQSDVGWLEVSTKAMWCDLSCDSSEEGEPVFGGFDGTDGDEEEEASPGAGGDDEEDVLITGFGGPRAYSAGLSIPRGLPRGEHELIVDGRLEGRIRIE